MAKDRFSSQSDVYAKYRPVYPQDLFDYLLPLVATKQRAWDCATGNGQAARVLAGYFEKVDATDISEAQLANAVRKENIEYHVCPAEHTPFADDSFDLITVATAYHWLHWKKFHVEATRVGKQNALIAIWAYNLITSADEQLNRLIDHFYYDIIAPYWDPERKFVEASYTTVDFPYAAAASKNFDIPLRWTREAFTGYLQTWSGLQNYIKKNKTNPLELIRDDLHRTWPDGEEKDVCFPLFMRFGRIEK